MVAKLQAKVDVCMGEGKGDLKDNVATALQKLDSELHNLTNKMDKLKRNADSAYESAFAGAKDALAVAQGRADTLVDDAPDALAANAKASVDGLAEDFIDNFDEKVEELEEKFDKLKELLAVRFKIDAAALCRLGVDVH